MRTTTVAASIALVSTGILDGSNSVVSAFAPSFGSRGIRSTTRRRDSARITRLYSEKRDMRQAGFVHDDASTQMRIKRDQSSLLSAVAMDALEENPMWDSADTRNSPWSNSIQPVLSAALLVTGNTVGASCLVLPEMAAQPGMATSTLLFLGAYVVNLISGLILAEVAIKQHDSSGDDVPSSFKEFADVNLDLPMAGTLISSISLFVNTLIMSFDITRAGQIMSNFSGMEPFFMSCGIGALLVALGTTMNVKNLSSMASVAVSALFMSFAGLLLPGLANVQDPLAAFFTPGTSCDLLTGVSAAAPIILMTLVYQNIVPSVTKLLNYDRTKTMAALGLGSAIPLCMYLAWCFASIGGGIGASGTLLTAFSLAAVSGSSIGAIMSISEEIETFLPKSPEKKEEKDDHRFSPLAVTLSVAAPLSVAYMFDDINAALQIAGGYGSPLLYGAIPVAMAWTQRNRIPKAANMVPGGAATLGGLGAAATAFIGHELMQDVGMAMAGVAC